ncbi:MAG: DinB family protein [Bacteroidota bacterium]
MKDLSKQLNALIDDYSRQLNALQDDAVYHSPKPGKWSGVEEMGHLVDSAHSNIRRFVVSQYEELPLIVYRQDEWVKISDYQQWSFQDIVQLWRMMNIQMCNIWNAMPEQSYNRLCRTGADVSDQHTLIWLAADYIKHVKHHLHHLLNLAPVNYP